MMNSLAKSMIRKRYATFDADERETIIKVLDAMIAKHNMASTIKAMES